MKNTTCRETIDLLMDYLEERLPPEDREALDAHFAACAPCLAFVRSYRETPRILREATAATLPGHVEASLKTFLRAKTTAFKSR